MKNNQLKKSYKELKKVSWNTACHFGNTILGLLSLATLVPATLFLAMGYGLMWLHTWFHSKETAKNVSQAVLPIKINEEPNFKPNVVNEDSGGSPIAERLGNTLNKWTGANSVVQKLFSA